MPFAPTRSSRRSPERSRSTSQWSAAATPGSGPRSRCASGTRSWSVALLEARAIGDGPSGRNGGFLHGYWSSIATLRSVLGDGAALQLAHASSLIVPSVRGFLEQRGEDVWLREGGLLKVAATEAEDGSVERSVRAARELGVEEEAVALGPDEVRLRLDSPRFRAWRLLPRRRESSSRRGSRWR